jgi:hypothetical protein
VTGRRLVSQTLFPVFVLALLACLADTKPGACQEDRCNHGVDRPVRENRE